MHAIRAVALVGVTLATACLPGDRPPVEPEDPALASGAPGEEDAPRFVDFPAHGIFRGAAAEVDITSHPEAASHQGELRDGAGRGPNFAGHYTVVSWSCGIHCRELMIVDARSGRVFAGAAAPGPVRFRLDSRLLVVESPHPAGPRARCSGCGTSYFVWENERLVLLSPETWLEGGPPPQGLTGLLQELRVGESALLGEPTPEVARPYWKRLVIAPRSAGPTILEDRVEGEDLAWAHVFRGRVESLDGFLVELVYYPEGGRFLLVDAESGRVTNLDAPPVPSPSGARFITTSLDLVAGHAPNRARVYRSTPSGPVIEWFVEPKEWGLGEAVWQDERTVRLERATVDWSRTPLEMLWEPVRLEWQDGEWRLVP